MERAFRWGPNHEHIYVSDDEQKRLEIEEATREQNIRHYCHRCRRDKPNPYWRFDGWLFRAWTSSDVYREHSGDHYACWDGSDYFPESVAICPDCARQPDPLRPTMTADEVLEAMTEWACGHVRYWQVPSTWQRWDPYRSAVQPGILKANA
jgi:hypothetical protein